MAQHTRKSHFLGTKLRTLRKRNGLTLEDLSARCTQLDSRAAPSVSYLSMIESGKLVFGALAERGLADAIPPAGRRYSIPTDLLNPDKASAVRIDHILVNAAIEVVSGEVVHSPHSNQASDHHPVMIEFRVR